MAEYIELSAAIAKIREEGIYGEGHSDEERENDVIYMLESIPAADVAPVVHGRWIDGADSFGGKRGLYRVCGHCNICIPNTIMLQNAHWQYCPNCGAKMDGEENE